MSHTNPPQYSIPAKFRRLENLHIVFWLFKDISWCMNWRLLGIVMILPTLMVAIYMANRTKHIKSELAHNIAVAFWILANSYWMVSEFFGFDEAHIVAGYEAKHIAMIPFLIGVVVLAYYYIIQRPKDIRKQQPVSL
jgi:hypothetical protein